MARSAQHKSPCAPREDNKNLRICSPPTLSFVISNERVESKTDFSFASKQGFLAAARNDSGLTPLIGEGAT
jgi:hypothetical protein